MQDKRPGPSPPGREITWTGFIVRLVSLTLEPTFNKMICIFYETTAGEWKSHPRQAETERICIQLALQCSSALTPVVAALMTIL